MVNENHKQMKGGKSDVESYIQFGIIAILVLVIAFTATKVYSYNGVATGFGTVSASDIIPTGIPAVYGQELGVSYDDVSSSNPQTTEIAIAMINNGAYIAPMCATLLAKK